MAKIKSLKLTIVFRKRDITGEFAIQQNVHKIERLQNGLPMEHWNSKDH
ncbi:hypothetical protein RvY_04579 [Ramazzottius varieornatus]|uniref:Uncharacterized protein n=1 Tax=Ramazzottius varieornatus TaxID=947166 RepID=A0A1D1V198_RAMVA|nr:hypothetical protein RvY_04579 [Ramazzottius varieornatus]